MYFAGMLLNQLARGNTAIVLSFSDELFCQQLRRAGLRAGTEITVLSRTASRGYLLKIDDTRIAISRKVAADITCELIAA